MTASRDLYLVAAVRERATLQALPWDPALTGKTVGNAVPPPMAEAVVRQVLAAHARVAA